MKIIKYNIKIGEKTRYEKFIVIMTTVENRITNI
jgi:hypothetical protein